MAPSPYQGFPPGGNDSNKSRVGLKTQSSSESVREIRADGRPRRAGPPGPGRLLFSSHPEYHDSALLRFGSGRWSAEVGSWTSSMVLQALRHLGQAAVDDQVMAKLRHALSPDQRRKLLRDARYTTDWIAAIVRQIAQDEVELPATTSLAPRTATSLSSTSERRVRSPARNSDK